MDLSKLKSNELHLSLTSLVQKERELVHEILCHVREMDRRRIFLDLGHPNLFDYLTRGLGYSPGAAQRRIDAARLSREVPQVAEKIQSGELSLAQVSLMQKAIRQSQRETRKTVDRKTKEELVLKIQNQGVDETQKILTQTLDIALVQGEKVRVQKNETLRLETTLTEEQMSKLKRCRDLLSHRRPGANWAEVMELLCEDFLKRKDPLGLKQSRQHKDAPGPKESRRTGAIAMAVESRQDTKDKEQALLQEIQSRSETDSRHRGVGPIKGGRPADGPTSRKALPNLLRKKILARDQRCQYRDPLTGKQCGSQYLLEVDHCQPVWAGGTNVEGNLQVLCKGHNIHKYRKEAQIRLF